MPTFAGLLDAPADPAWRGADLAPALRGETSAPAGRPVFAQGTSNKAWPHPYRMVLKEDWKLIEEMGANTFSLYNLRDDPDEQRNVIADEPERAAELRALLENWLDSFDHTFAVDTPADRGGVDLALGGRLRGMGSV